MRPARFHVRPQVAPDRPAASDQGALLVTDIDHYALALGDCTWQRELKGAHGMDRVSQLAQELDALHRRRGFNAEDVTERVGPTLASVVFGDNEPDPAYGRDLLRRWLLAAATDLPDDLRTIFLGASGVRDLNAGLTERLGTLAAAHSVSVKTISRRLKTANQLAAAALLNRSDATPDENPFAVSGWYVDSLVATAYLDDDRPRFDSQRDIIATHDGVAQICESWSIPKPPNEPMLDDLDIAALEGCQISEVAKISPSTWRVIINLGAPLQPRQRHRVAFSVSLPSRAYARPFNAFMPVRRTRSFRSVVHFGPNSGLTQAWRIDGVPPMAMDDGVPLGETFDLASGQPLVAEWKTVRRGLAYGIGWSW